MEWIFDQRIEIAISAPVYFVYYNVLSRRENLAQLALTLEEVENLLDLLALLAK